MAQNNSPDNEFDPEMDLILREHFDAEASDLRSPSDPWPWLESHMEEPAMPSFFSRLLGYLNPMRSGHLSPAFAVAGVAVVAVVVAAVVWVASGDGGPDGPGGLAMVPATEAPAGTVYPTADPAAATAPSSTTAQSDRQPSGPQGTAGPTGEQGARGASDTFATSVPTPAASIVAEVAVTRVVEDEAQMEEADEALLPIAMATAAPQATSAPIQVTAQEPAAMRGPAGTQGSFGAKGPAGSPAKAGSAAGGTPADTTFRDYQRQPFVEASEDNASTFSLDTDRTSFQLALNWAQAGYDIDPNSVRPEEWLNAFNYEYDLPTRSDEFAVTSDLFPHPLDEDRKLARITFQAPELVVDKPLNVTLVLDASGSMADGNRVDIARQAAESIRQSLRPNDRISVVHFTGYVIDQYTVEHTHPSDDRAASSIAWLQPQGSTNVQAGLNLGVELAARVRDQRPDAYNYVILMSDGVANVDATDPFAILETAYDPDASNPLRLITIGVGINNYNDPLLEQLAQHGNGWYRYLDSVEQAQATFTRENWLALSTPFADQTRAQVTWDTGTVERWRIIGYENRVAADENFTQDRKEFAEIYSGAATTVLYELELADSARPSGSITLGTIELRWVDPDTGDSRGQVEAISGDASSDFDGRDGPMAQFGAIVALTADLYGSLPGPGGEASEKLFTGLVQLAEQLRSLAGEMGRLDSYNDFRLVLDHMTESVEERLPPSSRSGYSR